MDDHEKKYRVEVRRGKYAFFEVLAVSEEDAKKKVLAIIKQSAFARAREVRDKVKDEVVEILPL